MSRARNNARLLTNSDGKIAKANNSTGTVIQVVTSSITTAFAVNTTNKTSILSASITPTYTTSKILILVTCDWQSTNPNVYLFITKNNNSLNPRPKFSDLFAQTGYDDSCYKFLDEQITYSYWDTSLEILNTVDNPNTTSICTYNWGVIKVDTAALFRVGSNSGNGAIYGSIPQITLMEISG